MQPELIRPTPRPPRSVPDVARRLPNFTALSLHLPCLHARCPPPKQPLPGVALEVGPGQLWLSPLCTTQKDKQLGVDGGSAAGNGFCSPLPFHIGLLSTFAGLGQPSAIAPCSSLSIDYRTKGLAGLSWPHS